MNSLQPIGNSAFYDLNSFLNGRNSVDDAAMGLLGDVPGKRLLHLQCHFEMETLSLASNGAVVTGVDFSPKAIETARSLAAETGLEARFIEVNVYDLPDLLEDKYDIVFTSHGTIIWLPDVETSAWTLKKVDVTASEFDHFNTGTTFEFSSGYSYARDGSSSPLTNREIPGSGIIAWKRLSTFSSRRACISSNFESISG